MDLQKTAFRNFLKRKNAEESPSEADELEFTSKRMKKKRRKENSERAKKRQHKDIERNFHTCAPLSVRMERPVSHELTEAADLIDRTQPFHVREQTRKNKRQTHSQKWSGQNQTKPLCCSDLRLLVDKWTSVHDQTVLDTGTESEFRGERVTENCQLSKIASKSHAEESKMICVSADESKSLSSRTLKGRPVKFEQFTCQQPQELCARKKKRTGESKEVDRSPSVTVDLLKKHKKKRKKENTSCREKPPLRDLTEVDDVKGKEEVPSNSINVVSQLLHPVRKKKKSAKSSLNVREEILQHVIDDASVSSDCDMSLLTLDKSDAIVKSEEANNNYNNDMGSKKVGKDITRDALSSGTLPAISEMSLELHITSSESECTESVEKDDNKELTARHSTEELNEKGRREILSRDSQRLNIRNSMSLNAHDSVTSEDEYESGLKSTNHKMTSDPKGILDQELHYCTQCDTHFDSVRTLISHHCQITRSIAPRPSGRERTLACTRCGRKFVYKGHLKFHIDTIHKGKRPYKCEVCDKTFSVMQTLVVHLRVHNKEKPYECELCDYKCITSTNLNRHYRRRHGMSQTHECRVCSYKFFREEELNIHLQLRHKTSAMRVLQSLV